MSPDSPIDRRDFLKIIFGTASVAMLGGIEAVLPEEVAARPVHTPYRLALEDGYIVDPRFDWEQVRFPTHRQHLEEKCGFSQLGREAQLDYLEDTALDDVREWSADEVEEWLDTPMEAEEFGDYEFASNDEWSPYAPGIEIFEQLGWDEAKRLGVHLVEGDHPGSSFTGVAFRGDVKALNAELARRGLNLVIAG